MPGEGPVHVEVLGGVALLVLPQVVGLVVQQQVPLPAGEVVVLVEVGVGRDNDPGAGILGVVQAADLQPEELLGGADPALDDFVAGGRDEDVVVPIEHHPLDDAQAHEGLPGAGAVREHDPAPAGLVEAAFGEVHVFPLALGELRQGGVDARPVGADDLGGIYSGICSTTKLVSSFLRRLTSDRLR